MAIILRTLPLGIALNTLVDADYILFTGSNDYDEFVPFLVDAEGTIVRWLERFPHRVKLGLWPN